MVRAVIYARYSTDQQREESIEDQFESCRRYIDSKGFDLVKTYSDAETSGASTINREGYNTLIEDAQKGKFDVVVAESRIHHKLFPSSK
ncbi:MAG: recombinase family protein [Methylocystaceae bacterium]|nr:recombinase family protein [Methylocystaceae bacterium]